MRRLLIACAVAAAAVLAAVAVLHLTGSGSGLPAVGSVIPATRRPPPPRISGRTLAGRRLNVASLRGAPVVVNFWGSWCAPCVAEAPVLARVAAGARRLGVRFVGVDEEEKADTGLAFAQEQHLPYPSISDPGGLVAAGLGTAAPQATPSTYILDARGRIAWVYFGRVSYGQLERAVTEVAR